GFHDRHERGGRSHPGEGAYVGTDRVEVDLRPDGPVGGHVTSRCGPGRHRAKARNASAGAGQEADEGAAGEEADELAVVDDGDVGDVAVVHLRRHAVEGVVRIGDVEVGDHDVGDGRTGGLLELVLEAVQRRRQHEVGAEEGDDSGNV